MYYVQQDVFVKNYVPSGNKVIKCHFNIKVTFKVTRLSCKIQKL